MADDLPDDVADDVAEDLAEDLADEVAVPPRSLLDWFEGERRDLPWRRTRDPWRILVSELMLQQTQVARVVPRYQAFVTRWPTPAACAASPAAEVVEAWAGLGYNRRALNLQRAAATFSLSSPS